MALPGVVSSADGPCPARPPAVPPPWPVPSRYIRRYLPTPRVTRWPLSRTVVAGCKSVPALFLSAGQRGGRCARPPASAADLSRWAPAWKTSGVNPIEQVIRDHDTVIEKFVALCSADERIVAAFLGGSYARAEADEFSDLDLCLITTDEAYEEVVSGRRAIIEQLGEPLFLEDFGLEGIVFFILADAPKPSFSSGARARSMRSGMWAHTEHSWTRKGASRAQSSPCANPIAPNRSKHSAASSIGSGTISRTSSQRSDAGNSGGPTANWKRCVRTA